MWLDYDNDHLLDVRAWRSTAAWPSCSTSNADGTFTETSTTAKLLCMRFHYAQLVDVNGDGHLDFLCPDEPTVPTEDLRHVDISVEEDI